MPFPKRKSPLKSVCHISLQCSFSNRWNALCFTDSAGSIRLFLFKILQHVLSLGSPFTPADSKAARIVFQPQAGCSIRICMIFSSTSTAVLEGCWFGLLLWSQSGRPCSARLIHLCPVFRLIPYWRHNALMFAFSNEAAATNSFLCSITVFVSHDI